VVVVVIMAVLIWYVVVGALNGRSSCAFRLGLQIRQADGCDKHPSYLVCRSARLMVVTNIHHIRIQSSIVRLSHPLHASKRQRRGKRATRVAKRGRACLPFFSFVYIEMIYPFVDIGTIYPSRSFLLKHPFWIVVMRPPSLIVVMRPPSRIVVMRHPACFV